MKIIHVEDYFDPSANYQINEIIRGNKHNRDEVVLICSTDTTPFYKKISTDEYHAFEKKFDIKILRLPVIFKISSRVFMKNLFKTIKKLNSDIVFFHGIGVFYTLKLFKEKENIKKSLFFLIFLVINIWKIYFVNVKKEL
ncbi:MAG: hypothetical protein ACRCSK_09165 [Fusobacteriaceae bacterium]